MEIEKVMEATNTYLMELVDIKNNLKSLPRNIAFYDRDGTLASSYSARIDKICEMVENETTTINNEISSSIGEETVNVKAGAANASESLNQQA